MSAKTQFITFSSWKGGTGKTTLQTVTAWYLSLLGKRILMIDTDSNVTMTESYFKMYNKQGSTSIQLFNGEKVDPLKTPNPCIDIIPSDERISKISNIGPTELNFYLSEIDLSSYDFVFIDPPGTMNAITRNALFAADKVVLTGQISESDFRCIGHMFKEMKIMGLNDKDVYVQINSSEPRKNQPGIIEKYYENYGDYILFPPISNMKSIKNLTSDLYNYKLVGMQKKTIKDFVEKIIL